MYESNALGPTQVTVPAPDVPNEAHRAVVLSTYRTAISRTLAPRLRAAFLASADRSVLRGDVRTITNRSVRLLVEGSVRRVSRFTLRLLGRRDAGLPAVIAPDRSRTCLSRFRGGRLAVHPQVPVARLRVASPSVGSDSGCLARILCCQGSSRLTFRVRTSGVAACRSTRP